MFTSCRETERGRGKKRGGERKGERRREGRRGEESWALTGDKHKSSVLTAFPCRPWALLALFTIFTDGCVCVVSLGEGDGVVRFSPKCVICPVGGNYSPIGTLIFPIVHLTGRAIRPIERCPTMTTFSLSLSHLSFSGGSKQPHRVQWHFLRGIILKGWV